jgi:hypothetical protein
MPILGVIASSRPSRPFLSGISYQQTPYLNGAVFAQNISWANGAYRAIAYVPVNSTDQSTSRCIYSSTDGTSWTLTASGITNFSPASTTSGWIWYTSAGYYICIAGNQAGSIAYSTDLINWTVSQVAPTATQIFPYGDVSPSNGMWFACNDNKWAAIGSGNPTGSWTTGTFSINQPNAIIWAGGSNWALSLSGNYGNTAGIYTATSAGGAVTRISGYLPYGFGRTKSAGLITAHQGSSSFYYSTNNGSSWNQTTGIGANIGYTQDNDSSGVLFTNTGQSFAGKVSGGGSWSTSDLNITGSKFNSGQSQGGASSSATNVLFASYQNYYRTANSGSSWSAMQSIPGTVQGTLAGITYGFGKFVALKNDGTNTTVYMLTSTDGDTWTETNISSPYAVSASNISSASNYVYSYNNNNTIYNYNGTSWTTTGTPTGSYATLTANFSGNGSVTIVGDSSGNIHYQTSVPNAQFATTSSVGTYIVTTAYGNGIFVAGDN